MFAAIVALGLAFLSTAQVSGFTQSYCSSQNTGSGDAYAWQWQSNGNCTNHCSSLGTWAYAVIEYTDCWCTNYVPSTTTSISDCQEDCPGYPPEKCGNKDAGLYIYIEMSGQPSGTAAGSQSSSTSVSSATSIRSSTDITSSSSDAVTSSSSISSSTLRTIVTSSASAPSTSVQVITESGAIITRTIIYQPTESAQQTSSSGSGSSNTGAIVGGVVGGVAAMVAAVGGILFFLWRRKKQQRAEQEHQAGITRNTSTMSKSGLLGGRSAAIDSQYPPPIATNHSAAGSRQDNESISPTSGSQRRYSQPMMIDSRLNPETVLMYHPTFATSRESLGSIDDSRDYGRQLNVRNPDPH